MRPIDKDCDEAAMDEYSLRHISSQLRRITGGSVNVLHQYS